MARSRLDLHEELCKILGSRFVYFQAPESVKMSYPCIRYSKDKADLTYADDSRYLKQNRYTITIIDKNPDSEIPDRLEELQYCSHDRNYVADNLNHFVYELYY